MAEFMKIIQQGTSATQFYSLYDNLNQIDAQLDKTDKAELYIEFAGYTPFLDDACNVLEGQIESKGIVQKWEGNDRYVYMSPGYDAVTIQWMHGNPVTALVIPLIIAALIAFVIYIILFQLKKISADIIPDVIPEIVESIKGNIVPIVAGVGVVIILILAMRSRPP